ncbi:MAG TPA: FKBP-type peptidyl-prolyl cis-trans isomerase [Candidatus Bathyarchaeia archaeon]|nr:FKBP-type peptidyl-prolyl cis-trans isomerase [Candidatus Bathyarchaeia archaeon]
MSSDIRAQKGDTVSVHYLGRFPGGKVFDTSMEKEARNAGLHNPARDYNPLQVTLGTGKVIVGFEEALIGMRVNEEKEVTIPQRGRMGNLVAIRWLVRLCSSNYELPAFNVDPGMAERRAGRLNLNRPIMSLSRE